MLILFQVMCIISG